MEGPYIHKLYMWEQMGIWVYVCFPMSIFYFEKKEFKGECHSKPLAVPAFAMSEASI